MGSITTWVRLEPRPRDGALEESLQAQVRDPLWLLARQWQFGEFQGENAGSLVEAELVLDTGQVDGYAPGPWVAGAKGVDYNPLATPLEALVEAEPPHPDLRHAARAGQMFLHFLRQGVAQQWATAFTTAMPLPAPGPSQDQETRRFLRVMAGKTPNGVELRKRFPTNRKVGDPLVQVPQGQALEPFEAIERAGGPMRAGFLSAARQWLDWYDGLVTQPSASAAWVNERMEYAFTLSAPFQSSTKRLELTADEYPGGHLDWYAFDAHTALGAEGTLSPQPQRPIVVLPTPVEFKGMPANRFWQFEERQVDFGSLDTAPSDLGKLLLAEFALVFGNDFFYIPVTLPVGSVSRVVSLKVRDTFYQAGEDITIPSASQVDAHTTNAPPWRMFCLSPARTTGSAAPEYMFLPPSLIHSLEGPPLEEVLLLRDEMANMAWAVERIVQNPVGKTINRYEMDQLARQQLRDQHEAAQPGALAPKVEPLTYRLFSSVPQYWNPMLLAGGPGVRSFNLKGLEDVRGALLSPYVNDKTLTLFEEEVLRSGVRLSRAYQCTRWSDGSRHLWVGRKKQPERGEGSSGLRFDSIRSD